MELDEPCVLGLYSNAVSTPGGLGLASCYGVRPPDLVGGREGDPHHPIHGILTLSKDAQGGLNNNIETVRAAATQNRLLGWVAEIQRRREQGSNVADTRGDE